MAHPEKLKEDCILEALCDIRFSEPHGLPEEVIIGRLIDRGPWEGWHLSRLPGSDIPEQVRKVEEKLRFQPSIQLSNNNQLVKVGSNVLSLHFVGPYPGWNEVRPQLHRAVDLLFKQFKGLSISRVGLRYINAFEAKRHYIKSLYDLDISITIDNSQVDGPANLNFMRHPSRDHTVMSRLSSLEFVKGKTPTDTSSIADIDVFTNPDTEITDANTVKNWIEEAHEFEKEAFFALIPQPIIDRLREK